MSNQCKITSIKLWPVSFITRRYHPSYFEALVKHRHFQTYTFLLPLARVKSQSDLRPESRRSNKHGSAGVAFSQLELRQPQLFKQLTPCMSTGKGSQDCLYAMHVRLGILGINCTLLQPSTSCRNILNFEVTCYENFGCRWCLLCTKIHMWLL